KNNNWEFINFYINELSNENEIELFRLFFLFVVKMSELNKNNQTRLFHWHNAEKRFIDKFLSKNNNKLTSEFVNLLNNFNNKSKLIDGCDIFKNAKIIINGSKNF